MRNRRLEATHGEHPLANIFYSHKTGSSKRSNKKQGSSKQLNPLADMESLANARLTLISLMAVLLLLGRTSAATRALLHHLVTAWTSRCPAAGSQDYNLGQTAGGVPIPITEELRAVFDQIPAALDRAISTLHAPSASILVVQGGSTLHQRAERQN